MSTADFWDGDTLTVPGETEKDVFNAFLVESACYNGLFDFPIIQPTQWIPYKLISFSKAINCPEHDQWVHFFEDDCRIERNWKNPKRYLPILKRFNGVILPDFSLYRDMPFAMKLWNIYRSRAIGGLASREWRQSNCKCSICRQKNLLFLL